ncbi:ligand-binding sensor domain-containing protein [Neolewinella sp.]|uniref:ligand-binding sensor domain-containing protein n=1 Tax=Neolewinella sp. TaxID=2993543 RepID=UPI003B521071
MKYLHVLTFMAMVIFGTACNGSVEKELPKEKSSESNILPDEYPKLLRTIGHPRFGSINCGLQDKEGNLWFGTTSEGLYKYDGKSFRQFLIADGLNSNDVTSIMEDKEGNIWIGGEAGFCFFDGKTFSKISIPLPKNLPPNDNPPYSKSKWVFDIMQVKSGKIWFATIDGVFIYDGKSFTHFIVNEGAPGYVSTNNNVERMLEDKEGNIWLGGRTNTGVYRYDGKSLVHVIIEELRPIHYDPDRLNYDWAWPQLQDKNGNIWFSNWGGAYRYDGKSYTSFSEKDGLSGIVTRIIEDTRGNLWFGGDGISHFDGKSFTRFTTKDGLIDQGVWSILEDKAGNLWIGTRETGLYLYDGKTFINYTEEYKR